MFYTGAAPNQQAIPAVEYLMSKDGGSAKRWVLLGTDLRLPAHHQHKPAGSCTCKATPSALPDC